MGKTGTFYYENVEGGHGGAADNKQRAFMNVLAYDFLEQALTGSLKGGPAAPRNGDVES
jgi:prolyl oligopeptidase PreP (S9A serine peptidase family)